MNTDFDVCIIGSGAAGGAVAAALSAAGRSVVVLEKGPWLHDSDFSKDEIAASRRGVYAPDRKSEPQVVETYDDDGWNARPTPGTGWDFWNGSMVGGASNLMSGFFHRMKPDDFRLRSALPPIDGADIADWPIGYDDLEPWYTHVEQAVGISGRVTSHPLADRRSTKDFPYPPLTENPLAKHIDETCQQMGLHSVPVPRAVLSVPQKGRGSCSYTGLCGEYGCATGAKGSSRAALLSSALATGRCQVRANCMVRRILLGPSGKITGVEYMDPTGQIARVDARIYVVACQAIETARLLLASAGPQHPAGLANKSGMVGRNLLFSTAAWAKATLPLPKQSPEIRQALEAKLPWINRAVQDFYFFTDDVTGQKRKGGTIEFMLSPPNPISQALSAAFSGEDGPLYGLPLKRRLEKSFATERHLVFEVFADWLPHKDCHVTLDPSVKDKWGLPVARVRVGKHPHNKKVADFLLARGVEILTRLGGEDIIKSSRGAPATNLVAGTCRFGDDPKASVLDKDCRAHDVDNLFVADASFMPTAGSIPPTWTVYANAFRIARTILGQLGG